MVPAGSVRRGSSTVPPSRRLSPTGRQPMADARTIAQDASHARAVQRGEEALHSLDGSPADPLVARLKARRDDSYEAARRLASAAAGKPLSLLAEQEFAGLISDGLEAERVLKSV